MIRWHAELYINKSRSADAIYSSPTREGSIQVILHYVLTMVRDEDKEVKIILKPKEIKGE